MIWSCSSPRTGHEYPTHSRWASHGQPMGNRWAVHRHLTESSCTSHRQSIAIPWAPRRMPVDVVGLSVDCPLDAHGPPWIPMVCAFPCRGQSVGYQWDARVMPVGIPDSQCISYGHAMDYPWGTHGRSPWATHGQSVDCPLDAHGHP